jgi:alpha-N-acetylglucosaminidase
MGGRGAAGLVVTGALVWGAVCNASDAWAGSPAPGTGAARAVLERTLGPAASRIGLARARLRGPSPWYRVRGGGAGVQVVGDSPIALTRGAYAYLTSIGALSLSWEGRRVALPPRFPTVDTGRVATPFAHRAYLNPCTYGYTTPWWGWSRWSREIDAMALHGVDMPLALEGQEYVWRALWREMGLSDAELGGYFSGPAFVPWQRMGNLEGHHAPLPSSWIDKKHALQIKILHRMRSLGMSPILPAFAGYVPKAFALRHPEARIYRMRPWEGFSATYWLDPADPLFAKLSRRFLELYTQTYGPGAYYLADAFNETLPPISDDGAEVRAATYGDDRANAAAAPPVSPVQKSARLAAYGEALYQSIHAVRPKAVWVMQGWLFGADSRFWTKEAVGGFLGRIPDDKLLVLDIGNDRYPDVWRNAGAFHGKAWIYGYVHNYGGSNPLYGDLDFYRRDLAALRTRTDTGNLRGFGVFPEGLESNSIVYDYLYDLAWGQSDQPLADWLTVHLRARYGHVSPALLRAWSDLAAAVYRTRYWTPRWWRDEAGAYLIFKRPTAAIAGFPGEPDDHAQLAKAVSELAAVANDYAASPLFRDDLIDALRQLASEDVDALLQAAVADYEGRDLAAGDAAVAKVKDIVGRLDILLGAEPWSLARWVGEARSYGDTAEEAQAYVRDAKAQITVWGGQGNLHDYASKAWQGMYAGFYLPRWTMFLAALRQSAANTAPFDEAKVVASIATWEQAWAQSDATVPHLSPRDPLADARALLARLDQP